MKKTLLGFFLFFIWLTSSIYGQGCFPEISNNTCPPDTPKTFEEIPTLIWPLEGDPSEYDPNLLPFGDPWCNHRLAGVLPDNLNPLMADTPEEAYAIAYSAHIDPNFGWQSNKVSCWGRSVALGMSHIHTGVDIKRLDNQSMVGKKVFPAFKGEVIAVHPSVGGSADWGSFNWTGVVALKHKYQTNGCSREFITIYWHIVPTVKSGECIGVTDNIGTVADIDDVAVRDKDHLHFGIRMGSYTGSEQIRGSYAPDNDDLNPPAGEPGDFSSLPDGLGTFVNPMKIHQLSYKKVKEELYATSQAGIIEGKNGSLGGERPCSPGENINRAQAVKALGIALYPDDFDPEKPLPFVDVVDDLDGPHSWFVPGLRRLHADGAATGYAGTDEFRPLREVSRAEFMKMMMVSYEARVAELDMSQCAADMSTIIDPAAWYFIYFQKAACFDEFNGRSLLFWTDLTDDSARLKPITRAEMAHLIFEIKKMSPASEPKLGTCTDLGARDR